MAVPRTGFGAAGKLAKGVVGLDIAFGSKIRAKCTPVQLAAYNAFVTCAAAVVANDFVTVYEP